ncbi:conserved oligomeric Golgi complex subunit 5-like, partial [Trifolium medium]|nr:conserved oligomeric Golgi complex subunit 5-like [Trifolium medium]
MKAITGSSGSGFGPSRIRGTGTLQIGGGGAKAREALWQRL